MLNRLHAKFPFSRQSNPPSYPHWRNFMIFAIIFITFLAFEQNKLQALLAIPITETSQNIAPPHVPQFMCLDPWITTFISTIIVISAIIYLYRRCCKFTICKRFKCAKHCHISLSTIMISMSQLNLRSTLGISICSQ